MTRRWRALLGTLTAVVSFVGVVGDVPKLATERLPGVGTITMAVRRPTFVVLGADRLAYQRDSAGGITKRTTHAKFALHPTLPIGIVHSGLGSVAPGPRQTNPVVTQVLAQIRSEQLNPTDLVRAFSLALEGPVRQARADIRKFLTGSPASVSDKIMAESHLTLLVGFVAGGNAVLLAIKIEDSTTHAVEGSHLGAPPTLARFYESGKYQADADVFGKAITDSKALASHVRSVIADGIREDARLNNGKNNVVGGGIDVVVVDASGAKLQP